MFKMAKSFVITKIKKISLAKKPLKPKIKKNHKIPFVPAITKVNLPSIRQLIVVDGTSVALEHSNVGTFSVNGLAICLRYFENLGYDVKAIVPQFRCKAMYSSDNRLLQRMEKEHRVCISPCKTLNGVSLISDVNRIVLDVAAHFNAAVVSNHDYSDIVTEKNEWSNVVPSNVVNFKWNGNEITFSPKK